MRLITTQAIRLRPQEYSILGLGYTGIDLIVLTEPAHQYWDHTIARYKSCLNDKRYDEFAKDHYCSTGHGSYVKLRWATCYKD